MDFQTVLALLLPLSFLIYWVISVEKNITNKNWSGLLTQVSAFLASFLVITLYAHSTINLGDTASAARDSLGNLAWPDLALLALIGAATGGSFSDYLRARNNSDGTVQPTLVPDNQDVV